MTCKVSFRHRLFGATCALLILSGNGTAAADKSQATCQVVPVAEWQDRSLHWDGGCKGGKAEGSGVLRAYEKKSGSPEIFYGRMHQGELSWGVMEVVGGYKAGRFVRGELQNDGERNTIIRAFEIASSAAKAYSQRLQKTGNAVSAKFYRNKADKLDRQMD